MKPLRNVRIWYITTFFTYAAYALPIWVVFNTDFLGLNNAQAFFLGVLPWGLSAVFEIPTGSWADKYGRAKVYQLGTVLYLVSTVSYLLFKDFYVLAVFQLLGAMGIAMQSGSLEALIHDSIPEPNKHEKYAAARANNNAVQFSSRTISVLAGGLLYSINPRAPFAALAVSLSVGLAVSFMLRDVRTETPSELSSLQHIKKTFQLMTSVKPIMVMILLFILYRLTSETLFALYQPYFKSLNIDVADFGIFYAIISACTVIGSLWVGRLARKYTVFHIMPFMIGAVAVTLVGMLFRIPWLTYLLIIPSGIAFGFKGTLEDTAIQRAISSRHQATALSINSFISTGTFFAAVVLLGVLLDRISVESANTIYAGMAVLFIIPFILNIRRVIKAKAM